MNFRFTGLEPILIDDNGNILGDFIDNISFNQYANLDFAEYQITDSDTPENICYRMYGDSSLSWILLFLNDIVDPFFEWPLNTQELDTYITNKYSSSLYAPHHYIFGKYIVNSNYPNATAISNYQYESDLNNTKRTIYIPSAETMRAFIDAIQL